MQDVDFDGVEFGQSGSRAADVLGQGVVEDVGGAVLVLDQETEIGRFA